MFSIPLAILKMKQFGSWVLANWRVAVGVMVILFIVFLTWHVSSLKNALKEAQAQSDEFRKVAEHNAAMVAQIANQADETISAIVAERDKAVARFNAAQEQERKILNEPNEDDGAVAPTLRRSIERLSK